MRTSFESWRLNLLAKFYRYNLGEVLPSMILLGHGLGKAIPKSP